MKARYDPGANRITASSTIRLHPLEPPRPPQILQLMRVPRSAAQRHENDAAVASMKSCLGQPREPWTDILPFIAQTLYIAPAITILWDHRSIHLLVPRVGTSETMATPPRNPVDLDQGVVHRHHCRELREMMVANCTLHCDVCQGMITFGRRNLYLVNLCHPTQ